MREVLVKGQCVNSAFSFCIVRSEQKGSITPIISKAIKAKLEQQKAIKARR